jgi:RimJ/RimL family protein N-acetyltransferase
MNVQPITLTGRIVRLEPLSLGHVPDLTLAGGDETIWRYLPFGLIRTQAEMTALVQDQLARQTQGSEVPFAVISLETGRAIGSTRYMDIQRQHRGLEIGGTWYAREHQRTGVNTECKYQLLRHAFEILGCFRVLLKTDLRNERSQKAIERLGAVREGVLRKNLIMPDGYARSTVVYSNLDDEWPGEKDHLERLIRSH